MAANSTLPPLPPYELKPLAPLIPGFPDQYLALALPVIAYWVVSLIFHLLDTWDLFPQYRLHTPAEVLKRNHASRWDVFRDVLVQQLLQTVFGLALAAVEGTPLSSGEDYDVKVWARRIRIVEGWIPMVLGLVGVDASGLAEKVARNGYGTLANALKGGTYSMKQKLVLENGQRAVIAIFAPWEIQTAQVIYHLLIPACQFAVAICLVDTWQYFLHRAMHMNKYLYTTLHSRHHRLYVPYAYGALYNHPIEGLFMDTAGTGLAYLLVGMTCRQSMWFYTMTTIKTVDDHCGYSFPWDPLQHVTSNNAGYHDVHHQSWGIKTNFSQPFFTFWDKFLGTKWTGGDVSARYERAKIAAQKKVDESNAPVAAKVLTRGRTRSITGSVPSESLDSKGPNPYADSKHISPSSADTKPERRSSLVIPPGKATQQALASRQMVLEVDGPSVLAEESAEERAEIQTRQQARRTSPRKRPRTTSSGFKGFADRVGESLQGKGTGVLGVESGRR